MVVVQQCSSPFLIVSPVSVLNNCTCPVCFLCACRLPCRSSPWSVTLWRCSSAPALPQCFPSLSAQQLYMCCVYAAPLQVISMVCHSVEVQQCASPFLIVSPASVLSNWAQELQHWAPDLSVVQYRGSADAREEIYRKQVC